LLFLSIRGGLCAAEILLVELLAALGRVSGLEATPMAKVGMRMVCVYFARGPSLLAHWRLLVSVLKLTEHLETYGEFADAR